MKKGSDAVYIGLSDDFNDPAKLFGHLFDSISSPDTIMITRGKEVIREAYLYRLNGLKDELDFSNRGYDPAIKPDGTSY
jgi:hypothetical protein